MCISEFRAPGIVNSDILNSIKYSLLQFPVQSMADSANGANLANVMPNAVEDLKLGLANAQSQHQLMEEKTVKVQERSHKSATLLHVQVSRACFDHW